ncbi:MAG: hypothetical protein WBD02_06245 [Acidimicrobiia bacterium]
MKAIEQQAPSSIRKALTAQNALFEGVLEILKDSDRQAESSAYISQRAAEQEANSKVLDAFAKSNCGVETFGALENL